MKIESFFVKCANDSIMVSESDFKDLKTRLINGRIDYQLTKESCFENNQVKIVTIVINPSSLLKLYFRGIKQ